MSPKRTCIGCRRVASVDQLVRVALSEGGSVVVGRSVPGRGAWLCAKSPRCVELAIRRDAFRRALRVGSQELQVGDLVEELNRDRSPKERPSGMWEDGADRLGGPAYTREDS